MPEYTTLTRHNCMTIAYYTHSIQFKHLYFTDKKSVSYSCTEYGKMANKGLLSKQHPKLTMIYTVSNIENVIVLALLLSYKNR